MLYQHRELSTFDPISGNAVYNYEVGAMILRDAESEVMMCT